MMVKWPIIPIIFIKVPFSGHMHQLFAADREHMKSPNFGFKLHFFPPTYNNNDTSKLLTTVVSNDSTLFLSEMNKQQKYIRTNLFDVTVSTFQN